ncbi:hypothetical protein DERF_012535 [Dermatophagoides farinae]|uniref:Uncharacterized protein n=1 Tax=Dermatophagoides farinae TaxID=6954 RepID=A0A922L1U0_DERFA|nr:hypothetical protein DERF_012535 [Dermatophagoides farinae]
MVITLIVRIIHNDNMLPHSGQKCKIFHLSLLVCIVKVYDDTTIVSIINRSHVGHEIKSSLITDEFKKKILLFYQI